MSSVIIRADGSRKLGMGHITRCLGLAESLESLEVMPVFVTRNFESEVPKKISNYGYRVVKIPSAASFSKDLEITQEAAIKYESGLIVTDLCNVDILKKLDEYDAYLRDIKKDNQFLVTIDDLNTTIHFHSDIVVNSNYGVGEIDYEFQSEDTTFLLGPKYFIFRREFIRAAKRKRIIKRIARNLLITMGGSDQLSLTEKVAIALMDLDEGDLTIRIIIGIDCSNEKLNALENIFSSFTGDVDFIVNCENMAEQMLWTDIVITGGGLTKYEAAVTGTPSIIISQVRHQHHLMKNFQSVGTAIYVGFGKEATSYNIYKATESLLQDYTLRKEMSQKGKELVDGKGVKRILSEIPKGVLNER